MADRETAEKNEVQMYRKLIARYAAGLVEDGDSLFINTSRNALQMLDYIQCRNVTVITNNGKAIGREYYDGISIILTGGELRHPKDAWSAILQSEVYRMYSRRKRLWGVPEFLCFPE